MTEKFRLKRRIKYLFSFLRLHEHLFLELWRACAHKPGVFLTTAFSFLTLLVPLSLFLSRSVDSIWLGASALAGILILSLILAVFLSGTLVMVSISPEDYASVMTAGRSPEEQLRILSNHVKFACKEFVDELEPYNPFLNNLEKIARKWFKDSRTDGVDKPGNWDEYADCLHKAWSEEKIKKLLQQTDRIEGSFA